MDMFIAGNWVSRDSQMEIRSPFSNETVDSVPNASVHDVEVALNAAVEGARAMATLPAHRRASILERAAALIEADFEDLASTITAEEGKPIREARAEAARIPSLLRLCAGEAIRISGEVLSMDAAAVGEGRLGFTLPEPCGVVIAITPFNYPALLVMHKVGPALAAGNAVVLKPAARTPLTALFLVRRLAQAGLPPLGLQCILGPGSTIGEALCADQRVRKISFTGSRDVGLRITRVAGLKRITCELGSNAALVIFDDADLEQTAAETVRSGFINAGQVCISAQRVLVPLRLRDPFVDRLTAQLSSLRPGDPTDPETTLGPVISESEAARVVEWIGEAGRDGATIVCGGGRSRTLVEPTVLLDPPTGARVWREELFGPAVVVRTFEDEAEALALTNDTRYGLAVGVFTTRIDRALHFARGVKSGVVHVNSGPLWRTDFMPYGGVGDSGFGKEGVRYALQEMMEQKLIVIHPGPVA